MSLKFEWDQEKARLNVEKHGVSFEEAATVFRDPFSLTIEDPAHSEYEVRFVTVGESVEQKMVVVVHTDRGAIRPDHQRTPGDTPGEEGL